jgi:hypothetical protein
VPSVLTKAVSPLSLPPSPGFGATGCLFYVAKRLWKLARYEVSGLVKQRESIRPEGTMEGRRNNQYQHLHAWLVDPERVFDGEQFDVGHAGKVIIEIYKRR